MVNSYVSLAQIEKEIRNETEIHSKYLIEKTSLETSNQTIQSSIIEKTNQIKELHRRLKELSSHSHHKDNLGLADAKQFNLSHEILYKELLTIQNSINQNFVEKYQIPSIEMLTHLQTQLPITYVIIKKLVLDNSFFINNKISKGDSLVDDLFICSKANKLNYFYLKSCGYSVTIHITNDTTLNDLLCQSCKIFNLAKNSYALYDDSFNNVSTCLESTMQNYFLCSAQKDNTIPKGIIVFYLLNKLTNQKNLFESQYLSIVPKREEDKKEEEIFKSDLDSYIELIMEGKLMKGLRAMRKNEDTPDVVFDKKIKTLHNSFYFFIFIVALIVLSFISVYYKRKDNTKITESSTEFTFYMEDIFNKVGALSTMKEYFQYCDELSDESNLRTYGMNLFGFVQWRLFKLKKEKCIDILGDKKFTHFINADTFCYYKDHIKNKRDESGFVIGSISFSFSEQNHIEHDIHSVLGDIDHSGTIITYWSDDLSNRIHLTNELMSSSSVLFEELSSFEIVFVIKLNANVYLANQIVVQRDMSNTPRISIMNMFPFKGNLPKIVVYLNFIEFILYCVILIISSLSVYAKYKEVNLPGSKTLIKEIYNSLFSIANIFLISSAILFFISFILSYSVNRKIQSHIDYVSTSGREINFDYIKQSERVTYCYYYELLSLYFLFLYSLRFLGLFDAFHSLIVTIQKIAYEFVVLSIAIAFLFSSLSLFSYLMFASHLREYDSFFNSLLTNIQIFIFNEKTETVHKMLKSQRLIAIVFISIFVLIIRNVIMSLFVPIFIEYDRIEKENYLRMKKRGEQICICKKMIRWICPCCAKAKKEKKDKEENVSNIS